MVVLLVIIVAAGTGAYYFLFNSPAASPAAPATSQSAGGRVITENLTLPNTTSVSAAEGSMVMPGAVAVPLVPENESEKVIVPNAVLTVKGTLAVAEPEAKKWASDARLVFVKSLGAVTLEGKSSQWQAIYDSRVKKKGYEIIVRGGGVISRKEIESSARGGALPETWQDSDYPIRVLQNLPQFADATVSSITLSYNADGDLWRYNLFTSRGPTSTGVN